MSITNNKQDKFLKRIQFFKEDDFTNKIFVPLMKEIGYARVEFHGGSYEEGKDFIASKIDEWGEEEVTVGQVKKFEGKRNSKSRQQYGEIIYQLRMCASKKIKCNSGSELQPKNILFVTPYQIDTRLQSEQFEALDINRIQIKVIDGVKLFTLCSKYLPKLIDEIVGLEEKFSSVLPEELINSELFSALHVENDIDCSEFYNDLNFFVGDIDSNIILQNNVSINNNKIIANKEQWEREKKIIKVSKDISGVSFFNKEIDEIEREFEEEVEKFSSRVNQELMKEMEASIEKLLIRKDDANNSLKKLKVELFSLRNSKIKRSNVSYTQTEIKEFEEIISNIHNLFSNLCASKKEKKDEIYNLIYIDLKKIESKDNLSMFSKVFNNIKFQISLYYDLGQDIESLKLDIMTEPFYKFNINKNVFSEWYNGEIDSHTKQINNINNRDIDYKELTNFLRKTEKLLRTLNVLFSPNTKISSNIEIVQSDSNNQKDKLEISAHSIFDTGCDIAVYGEAGAGKTTTLQMYAIKNNNSNSKTVLYFPLNRVSTKYKSYSHTHLDFVESDIDKLFTALLLYKNIQPKKEHYEDIKNILKRKSDVVIIFDGLDEAIKNIPWLLDAINALKEAYSNLQIIVSSRNCVKYIDNINFLGISLLPFTESQLIRFIRGWLDEPDISDPLIAEIKDNDLFDVAKNPLLATIICTLAKHGINVPKHEADVYRKKFELLTGLYDSHKNINRVKNPKDLLMMACRKIAYGLHSIGEREGSIEQLVNHIYSTNISKISKQKAQELTEELIDPCNIIKKEQDTGLYGFGHLRLQEFLASEEITHNRGIPIAPLLTKDWWRGVLYLYAKDNSIDSIIEIAYQTYGSLLSSQLTIQVMINARPPEEKNGLNDIFQNMMALDRFEDPLYNEEQGYNIIDDDIQSIIDSNDLYSE